MIGYTKDEEYEILLAEAKLLGGRLTEPKENECGCVTAQAVFRDKTGRKVAQLCFLRRGARCTPERHFLCEKNP